MKSPDLGETGGVPTPERSEFQKHQDYDQLIQDLLAAASDHSKLRFETAEASDDAGMLFIEEWWEKMEAVCGNEPHPSVTVSGGGIVVPNVEVFKDPYMFKIEFDEDNPAVPLEYPRTETGKLDSIYRSTGPVGSEGYQSLINMSLALDSSPSIDTKMVGFPLPIVGGKMTIRAFIAMTEDLHFEVPEYERMKSEAAIIEKIAKSGLSQTQLMKALQELSEVMQGGEEGDLQELEDTTMVKEIAQQCVDYVNDGKCSMDLITDRLIHIFKKGRPIMLADKKTEEPDDFGDYPELAEGIVEDVFFALDDHGKARSLNIAIQARDDEGDEVIQTFAMDQLEEVHF